MTKHIADRRTAPAGGRTAAFAAIARKEAPEGSHPAAQAAHRAPRTGADRRLGAFLKIARGREA